MLSTPYLANGQGIVQGSGPQFASVVPGVPLYEHQGRSKHHSTGYSPVVESGRFRLGSRSEYRSLHQQFADLPIRKSRSERGGPDFVWNDFYVTKWFPMTEHVRIRFDAQFFNAFNHPNFGLPSMVLAGIPGKPSTQNGFGALTYHDVASHWSIGSRPGRRQQSTHDRVSIAAGILA